MRRAYCIHLALLVGSFAQSGCSIVGKDDWDRQFAISQQLAGVEAQADLEDIFYALLSAQRDCIVSSKLRERIHQPPASWEDIEAAPELYCLGEIVEVRAVLEEKTIISFEITESRPWSPALTEDYIVYARLLESKWNLSWPTSLGFPELHPRHPDRQE